MNETWKSFIAGEGAVIADDQSVRFGPAESETRLVATGDVVADLSHLSLIRARGADAASFLQGQFSNDIRLLDGTRSQLSSYSTPQGRMLAVLRIFKRRDDFLLQLPASLSTDILKRLRMYVLRAKLTLESADAELQCIGVSGSGADARVRNLLGAIPETSDSCILQNETSVLRLPGPHPRLELVAPVATTIELWKKLRPGCRPVARKAWAWLDIMAGIPTVLPQTSEAFVPQMANVELLNGVSFNKGCYPGQEIVARMQYLGRLKQRMYRAHVASDAAPCPGDALYAPDFGDQAAGTVVEVQPAPQGGYDMLAVVQIGSVDRGDVHIGNLQGPRLEFQSLPYPIAVQPAG